MIKNIEDLIKKIKKSRRKNKKKSYTSFLLKSGLKRCIKKFNEESKEFSSSLYDSKKKIIHEAADMLYHFFVVLEYSKIKYNDIINELDKRSKFSGFEEKKKRSLKLKI